VYEKDTLCIGCARVGQPTQMLVSGTMEEVLGVDFGAPLHCFIICGEMHPLEQDYFNLWRKDLQRS
jgi:diphthine synthase